MENKINVAELLKDCPKGTELYSPLVGDCKFVKVHDYESQIIVKLETGATVAFLSDGRYFDYSNAECMLFPSKDKTAPFYVVGGNFYYKCIPYEDNEYLLGKTEDCDDFYKTW